MCVCVFLFCFLLLRLLFWPGVRPAARGSWCEPVRGCMAGSKVRRQVNSTRQRLGTYYQRFARVGRPYLPVSSWRSHFACLRFWPGSEPEEEWALLKTKMGKCTKVR